MVNTVYVTGRQTVLVSELPTTGNVYLNQKFLGPDAKMEFVTIKRRPAAWLYGAPHEVVVQRPSGDVATLPVRLAGNVLLWADDTRTIRIEGLNDRAAAIAILGRLI